MLPSLSIKHFQVLKDVLYRTLSYTQICPGSLRPLYGTDDETDVRVQMAEEVREVSVKLREG